MPQTDTAIPMPHGHRPSSSIRRGAVGRALRMERTGLWVVRAEGALAEIDGRAYWDSLEDLRAAAARAGLPLADRALHTGPGA